MAPISPDRRDAANRLPVKGPDLIEAEHSHICPVCGQAVDRRRLGDVIHHEAAGHAPIDTE